MLFSRFLMLPWVAGVLALTACDGSTLSNAKQPAASAPSASATAVVASQPVYANTYRVGVDPSYQPFIHRTETGVIEGFDVDLLKEIGKRENFGIEIVPKPWSDIFTNLDNKTVDIIMGGAVATDERREKWALSEPYYQVQTVLITKENSAINDFSDVKGKRVAYTAGGSVEKELKKWQGREQLDSEQNFASSWLRVKSVMMDTSDAAIGTSASFEYYAKAYPEQKMRVVYPKNGEQNDVVFVVNKENTELLTKLNSGLEKVKQDGTLEQLKNKWMNKK